MSDGSLVFHKRDLEAILRSVLFVALAQPTAETPHNAAFRQGIATGIAAVAVALGIEAKQITNVLPERRAS